MYDYLIVGAGMFGSTFARLATDDGKKCLIIDKREHIAGNCYSENQEGIEVHKYGPHIFHTNDDGIWAFVNRFTEFNNFINQPISITGGKVYSLPFNMYTFNHMWGVLSPEEAKEKIESQRLKLDREPANLEEQALTLVGTDIYEKLIKGYTTKQWQRAPKDLPASIIKRLPVRLKWDNNYFNDKYQGIPMHGYTAMFESMLDGIEVKLGVDYFADQEEWNKLADKVVFTGKIDEYYDFQFGELQYRTLDFESEVMDTDNYQGNAVINYGDVEKPWTRIVEHKHFSPGNKSPKTVVTKEYPASWDREKVPYYPIGDEANSEIFKKYRELAKQEPNVIFGGRLSEYRYYDMHQVIGSAMARYKSVTEDA